MHIIGIYMHVISCIYALFDAVVVLRRNDYSRVRVVSPFVVTLVVVVVETSVSVS